MCTKESPEVGQKTYDVVLTPKVSSDHVKWWEQPRIKCPVRDRKRTVSRQLAWQEFGYLAKGGKDKIVTEKKKQGMRIVPNRLGYDSTVSVIAPSDKPDQENGAFRL